MSSASYRLISSNIDLVLVITPVDENLLLKHKRPTYVIPLNIFYTDLPTPLKGAFISCRHLSYTAFGRDGYIFQGYYVDVQHKYTPSELRLTSRAPFVATLKRILASELRILDEKFVEIMSAIISSSFPQQS